MNNKGYSVVELLVVIAVVGVIAIFGISKASYAFPNESTSIELKKSQESLLKTVAIKYGKDNKDIFKESNTVFIQLKDLEEQQYLKEDELTEINDNQKIKIELKDDEVIATLEN